MSSEEVAMTVVATLGFAISYLVVSIVIVGTMAAH